MPMTSLSRNTILALDAAFHAHPQEFAGPVSDIEIRIAEESLNTKFHDDYFQFLARYGGGVVGAQWILGVRKYEWAPDDFWSVVDQTLLDRSTYGTPYDRWYSISTDNQYPIGITKDGRVMGYYFDSSPTKVELAGSFDAYIAKLLSIC